jgi:hypothetical protein
MLLGHGRCDQRKDQEWLLELSKDTSKIAFINLWPWFRLVKFSHRSQKVADGVRFDTERLANPPSERHR